MVVQRFRRRSIALGHGGIERKRVGDFLQLCQRRALHCTTLAIRY